MDSYLDRQAFLGAGAWIPVEVADQLSHYLKLLHAWTKEYGVTNPSITLLIEIELSEIDDFLDMSESRNVMVSAEQWRVVTQRIQLLAEQLASLR